MIGKFREKYIGDSAFYKRVLKMVVPMILQNLVTNFVSMIDNIMVGQIGTEQMSGVSIVNQFVFVFNITLFGAVSGPGIFGAQFFGKHDAEGQKQTVRFRVIICAVILAIGALIFGLLDDQLISLFISKDDSPEKIALTLKSGKEYMAIMIVGLIPFSLGQPYYSVVRECGETTIPMLGSMTAVGANLLLDYGLIFGKLGMPAMGVKGAAIATVIAKFIEAAVVIIWAHTHPDRNRYIVGLYKSMKIPKKLTADMIRKGLPLLVNEFLWAAGMSVIAQCYSERGLDVVAARNISGTITNLFGAVYIQLGACISIIVGAELGANRLKEARNIDDKMRFFSVAATVLLTAVIIPLATLFPKLYNTEENIRALSAYMIIIQALAMPLWSYTNACYFTLRSGGRTGLTFLFDFLFTWVLMIPLALIIAKFTKMDIYPMYVLITFTEIIKVVIGYFMVRSDIWINNIVNDK
ncbi:MATE family efflux transporter [Ruminococcus sp.]|uniref:MATE family efflux transporter n=1 Tax=Ruminococcus sp. TaxID=41978 RepID=UPI0025E5904B|nr:MATE family efflux transporter [Ruminococcus sp.]MBQ8967982.1 MATE family efflux transporter [Ruminococcus sp.]